MRMYQFILALLLAGVAGGFVAMRAQEMERGKVTVWQAGNYGGVSVIETPGACIYALWGSSLAVLPRTQLPAGKGC